MARGNAVAVAKSAEKFRIGLEPTADSFVGLAGGCAFGARLKMIGDAEQQIDRPGRRRSR